MFVDIVNFTRIAEGLNPQQVFTMLNRVFSSFDELAEKFGLEKIKTIGDAYMVAGGLNNNRDDYSDGLVDMALEMRSHCARLRVTNAVMATGSFTSIMPATRAGGSPSKTRRSPCSRRASPRRRRMRCGAGSATAGSAPCSTL